VATAETHSEPSGKFSSGTERTIVRTDGPPTAYNTKDLLKEWVDSRGIRYADYAMKIELHELIKTNQNLRHSMLIECWHNMNTLV
jgi:hypothetical protein